MFTKRGTVTPEEKKTTTPLTAKITVDSSKFQIPIGFVTYVENANATDKVARIKEAAKYIFDHREDFTQAVNHIAPNASEHTKHMLFGILANDYLLHHNTNISEIRRYPGIARDYFGNGRMHEALHHFSEPAARDFENNKISVASGSHVNTAYDLAKAASQLEAVISKKILQPYMQEGKGSHSEHKGTKSGF